MRRKTWNNVILRIGIILIFQILTNLSWANDKCQQPITGINVGNLACIEAETGTVVHNEYRGPYTLDLYSNDETNDWHRGDFYGLDDD